jgi:DNA gyrase subunit A
LDRVIALIRGAADAATARAELQATLGLSEAQADGILQMQLRRLTALEAEKIQAEHEDLVRQIADLRDILARRERVMQIISEELQQLKSRFASPRRSRLCLEDWELKVADLIENRETVIFLTEQGYIKRMDLEEFQVQGRATRGKAGARIKDDDAIEQFFACRSHDTILFFTDRGMVYTLPAYEIPQGSRTARGSAIVQLLPITREERVTSMVPVSEFSDDEYLVMLTRAGYIKKTALSAFANVRSNGLIAISLEENDELRWVRRARSSDDVVMATRQGMCIRFRADDEQLRPLGRATRGVRAITLNPGDDIVSMDIIFAESVMAAEREGERLANPWVLVITKEGRGKRSAIDHFRRQNRGGKGVIATKFRQESDELAALRIVNAEDEILLVTARGIVMRQLAKAIPTQSREATGVLVQRLDPEDSIVGVTVVPASFIRDPAEAEEEPAEGIPEADG